MGQFNYNALAAQEFSSITECRLVAVGTDFANLEHWLTQFMLNASFGGEVGPDKYISPPAVALSYAVLRRAHAAVEHFDAAAGGLAQFVAGNKKLSPYFRILSHLQGALQNTIQAIEFFRKAFKGPPDFKKPSKFYESDDGSALASFAAVHNVSRHGNPLALPEGHLQLDWITNEGLHVTDDGGVRRTVTFAEMREVIHSVASLADDISSLKFWRDREEQRSRSSEGTDAD